MKKHVQILQEFLFFEKYLICSGYARLENVHGGRLKYGFLEVVLTKREAVHTVACGPAACLL
jgi:hypothetical protein